MSDTRRVVWGEGMMLSPQHFQQWDRFQDGQLRDRARLLEPLHWGIRDWSYDAEAVSGGELRLQDCTLVFPDGTFCSAPGRDVLPAGRAFAELFAPDADKLVAYLCLPKARQGVPEVAAEDAPEVARSRYRMEHSMLGDVNGQGAERQIATCRANLQLRFEGEALDDFEVMALTEIRRTDTGGFRLDETFIPPLLRIGGSPWLMQAVRGLVDMLGAKGEDLAGQQRKTGGMAEVQGFWLLHTVNSTLPRILHHYRGETCHPETLFLSLLDLAAGLCTFDQGESPRRLPEYQHGNLRGCFGALIDKLRQMLGTVVSTRCLPLTLERTGETVFTCQVHDPALLDGAEFYIGIAADAEEERMVAELPAKVKISSPDRVQQLLMMAIKGLGIRHVPNPPQDIPVQAGRVYFQLEKAGEHWDAIRGAQAITMHMPPDFPGLRIDLMALKES